MFEIELSNDKCDKFFQLDRKELSDYYETEKEVILQDGICLSLINAHENYFLYPEEQDHNEQ